MHEEEIHFQNCNLIGFGRFDPGDLDIWPSDPKINRVPLLAWMDVWTKFEEGRSRHSRVNEWKRYGTFDPNYLDLWPSDPKINRVPFIHILSNEIFF